MGEWENGRMGEWATETLPFSHSPIPPFHRAPARPASWRFIHRSAAMIREALQNVTEGRSLSSDEAAAVLREILAGEASAAQVGALLTALRAKGETPAEIAGFARAMREAAIRVHPR